MVLDAIVRAYRVPPLPASVLTISASGATVQSGARSDDHDLITGDEVILNVEQLEIVATISWLKDCFLGLVFHRHLGSGVVGWLKETGRA